MPTSSVRPTVHQAQLDAQWNALLACDAEIVLLALNEAFADNEAAASAVGVDGTEVTLLVLVPGDSEIPSGKPTVTPAGNLSLKKLTKTETGGLLQGARLRPRRHHAPGGLRGRPRHPIRPDRGTSAHRPRDAEPDAPRPR